MSTHDVSSAGFIILIIGVLLVFLVLASFYAYLVFLLVFSQHDDEVVIQSRKHHVKSKSIEGHIILERTMWLDVLKATSVETLSEFSTQCVRGLLSLAILCTAVGVVYLTLNFTTYADSLEPPNHLETFVIINSLGAIGLILVGLCPISLPESVTHVKLRDFNFILCFNVDDKYTRWPHLLGALGFLFLTTTSTLWYNTIVELSVAYYVTGSIALTLSVVFIICMIPYWKIHEEFYPLIMTIEGLAFAVTVIHTGAFDLNLYLNYT